MQPLHLARGSDLVSLLTGHTCDLDASDMLGWTAAHHTVAAGDDAGLRELVAAGARMTVAAPNGCTPLHLAVMQVSTTKHCVQ
jgi:ankyrin repeat protein